jgi:hypothetical protein
VGSVQLAVGFSGRTFTVVSSSVAALTSPPTGSARDPAEDLQEHLSFTTGSGRTLTLPHAYRLSETLPDAEVNGRETDAYQALSSSAGHFAAQRLRVSLVRTNQHAAPDPGSAGVLAWR